jgi:hypothetical protein
MVPEIPSNPPLEIRQEGQVWVVAAYDRGAHDGTTYSTEETGMDALRAAKARMEADRHPCVVRWESPDSVRNLYWNPDFEHLDVRFDTLVDAWTIVPGGGTCAIDVCESRADAQERAKTVQRESDFKHLRVYDRNGTRREERDHRFLRYDVTDSGVRFDRDAVERQERPDVDVGDDEQDAPEQITSVGPATPGRLGVSVPDITQVEFVDTDGVCNQYETPWGDGTRATVVAVSQKHANHEGVREGFEARLEPWLAHDHAEGVATIHESGTDPTPWVAYQSGDYGLDDLGMDLSLNERIGVLGDVVTATATVSTNHDVCGIEPRNVRLRGEAGDWTVTVANWGIRWAATVAVRQTYATPFTAPEQLAGRVADTTAVYGVGALAYWLFCESTPVDAGDPQAIRTGNLRPPETLDAVPSAVEPVLERALATDPMERYGSVQALHTELAKLL